VHQLDELAGRAGRQRRVHRVEHCLSSQEQRVWTLPRTRSLDASCPCFASASSQPRPCMWPYRLAGRFCAPAWPTRHLVCAQHSRWLVRQSALRRVPNNAQGEPASLRRCRAEAVKFRCARGFRRRADRAAALRRPE